MTVAEVIAALEGAKRLVPSLKASLDAFPPQMPMTDAWERFVEPDDPLWIADRMGVDAAHLIAVARDCAGLALPVLEACDDPAGRVASVRVLACLAAGEAQAAILAGHQAIQWGQGRLVRDDPARTAEAFAAYACGNAATTIGVRHYAASCGAAWFAVKAWQEWDAAHPEESPRADRVRQACRDAVRTHVPWRVVQAAIERGVKP